MLTYFVVQGFQRTKKGLLVADTAVEARDEGHARRVADRFAAEKAGVVAFSRRGEPNTGEYEDAVILFRAGDVPGLDEELAVAC